MSSGSFSANTAKLKPAEPAEILAGQHAHQQPVRSEAHWGLIGAVLYAVIVYFVAQILAGAMVFTGRLLQTGDNERQILDWMRHAVTAQFWYVLLAEAITFGAIWWFVRWRKSTLRSIGWRGVRWRDPVYTFIAFWVYFIGYAVLLTVLTSLIPAIDTNQKQELGFDSVYGGLPLLLTFVSLVVLPPLVEEIVFRGFMYTGLRRKFKPWLSILITSCVFGLAHLQLGSGNPPLWVAGIDTFTLSLVLCYLRQKTDSLWPGIFLHASKNMIAFVVIYVLHRG